jgi:hypothetical protein
MLAALRLLPCERGATPSCAPSSVDNPAGATCTNSVCTPNPSSHSVSAAGVAAAAHIVECLPTSERRSHLERVRGKVRYGRAWQQPTVRRSSGCRGPSDTQRSSSSLSTDTLDRSRNSYDSPHTASLPPPHSACSPHPQPLNCAAGLDRYWRREFGDSGPKQGYPKPALAEPGTTKRFPTALPWTYLSSDGHQRRRQR